MAQNGRTLAQGQPGERSKVVLLSRQEQSNTPKPSYFQQKSRQCLAEARELIGADRFAALALASHFAGRMSAGAA